MCPPDRPAHALTATSCRLFLAPARRAFASNPIASFLGLNKNFILAYKNPNNDSLFYINPTSNGAIFEKTEIDRFLKEIGLKPQAQFYEPCDNSIIIKRLLCRLEYSYRNKHDFKNSDKVLRLINTLGTPLNKNIEWE